MIRLILFSIGALVATTSHAEELCAEWDKKIEPDMQIQEADFTLESYDKALDSLATLGREPRHELYWIAEGNALKFVKGWLLKKAAI